MTRGHRLSWYWPIYEALQDGLAHPHGEVFDRITWTIPAGLALNRREAERVRDVVRDHVKRGEPAPEHPPRRRAGDPATELLKARRTLFRRACTDLRRSGYLTIEGESIRLTTDGMERWRRRQRGEL